MKPSWTYILIMKKRGNNFTLKFHLIWTTFSPHEMFFESFSKKNMYAFLIFMRKGRQMPFHMHYSLSPS